MCCNLVGYDMYSSIKSEKTLLEALDKKYKTKDVDMNKFTVENFLYFKMVDSMTIMSQVQEFQLILHDINAEGMSLNGSFHVVAIIEKLSPY